MDLSAGAKNAQEARSRFLQLLYKKTGGEVGRVANWYQISNELSLGNDAHTAIYLLTQEGLIQTMSGGGVIMTPAGILAVESALTRPSEPAGYTPAASTIVVQSMVNSQIQQSSPGAVQTNVFDHAKLPGILELVRAMKAQAGNMGLSKPQLDELLAEVSTIEAQAGSSKPKPDIIASALRSLKAILEIAGGTLAATYLARLLGLM
jgi:hypothetical protein